MSAMGRLRLVVTVRELSGRATCYPEPSDRNRPGAAGRVPKKMKTTSENIAESVVFDRPNMTITYTPSSNVPLVSQFLIIDGSSIRDISSFYDEINRVFMVGEDWRLGPSLDALDDMLYGGYGALHGKACATVVWQNMHNSRAVLGIEATRAYHLAKLDHPQFFRPGPVRAALGSR